METRSPEPDTIPTGRIRLGLDDYLSLPDDGKRYEILDGILHVSRSPTTLHQRVSRRVLLSLMLALEHAGKGEVFNAPMDVVLGPNDVVQPDLLFVSTERSGIIGEQRIEGAPDLIVEILSPGTRRRDLVVTAQTYERCGVPHYWVVDPKRKRLEAFVLEHGEYRQTHVVAAPNTFEPPAFPGVSVSLEALFV